MNFLFHRLSHWFGLNNGTVVAATDRQRLTWIGFRCSECGLVSGKHIAGWHREPDDREFT